MKRIVQGFCTVQITRGGTGSEEKLFVCNTGQTNRRLSIAQFSDAEGASTPKKTETEVESGSSVSIGFANVNIPLIIVNNGAVEVLRCELRGGELIRKKKPREPHVSQLHTCPPTCTGAKPIATPVRRTKRLVPELLVS